jgi:hypothetical protein
VSRAKSTVSGEQHERLPFSPSWSLKVTVATSYPASFKRSAVTAESTPPLIAATTLLPPFALYPP